MMTSESANTKTVSKASRSTNTKPVTKTEPTIKLNAMASMGDLTVTIRNANNFDWFNVRLRIKQSDWVFGGYTYKAGTIKAGDWLEIGLLNFVDSKGNRFQPLQQAVKNLFITVNNKNGLEGASGWSFR